MSKRFEALKKNLESKMYSLQEAVAVVKKNATAKFDETMEVAIRLGLDSKKSDQGVRGTVALPAGTGRKVRVIVFTKGEKEKEAQDAGADMIGSTDLIEKIQKGWLDFDVAIASPDLMKDLGKVAKILGPRGLMPNPKSGTVTFEIAKAVKEVKAGKIEYKSDAAGIVHAGIGKCSFTENALMENAKTLIDSVVKAKPSTSKGQYLRSVSVSSTMGGGVGVDIKEFIKSKEE